MRLLEMRARWEPAAAEELLEVARSYASPKYAAIALRHLGPAEEVGGAGGPDRLGHAAGPVRRRAGHVGPRSPGWPRG